MYSTGGTKITITSGVNDSYLCLYYFLNGTDTLTEQQIRDSIQIEEGSQATDYEDFYDYKLCKIEDYKDAIFKNNQLSEYYDSTLDEDSWYIKKEISKTTFSGDDFSNFGVNSVASTFCQFTTLVINDLKPSISYGGGSLNNLTSHLGGTTSTKKIRINIPHESLGTTSSSTTTEAMTTLVNKMSGKTMICYYILATSTYEKITNSTLISQLEAITKLDTYNNYTAVTATGDLINPELECVLFSQPAYQK